jgi:large subunit ribosomal protein L19
MHKFLKAFEETQIEKIKKNREGKIFQCFNSGDTIEVSYKVVDEDSKESRIQTMTGVVIGKRNNMSSSTFKIKKILDKENSYIKTFMIYSPIIESIKVVKKGKVRRAKLNYLNKLYGKSARIKENKQRNK